MLVLTRKVGERIRIGSDIELTVLRISGGKVKLGFAGSPGIPIQREELVRGTKPANDSGASQEATGWLPPTAVGHDTLSAGPAH